MVAKIAKVASLPTAATVVYCDYKLSRVSLLSGCILSMFQTIFLPINMAKYTTQQTVWLCHIAQANFKS